MVASYFLQIKVDENEIKDAWNARKVNGNDDERRIRLWNERNDDDDNEKARKNGI